MAKLCTDIRQSKRLQELGLDTKTADLSWYCIDTDHQDYLNSEFSLELEPYSEYEGITGYEPAWSLPKLLELIPNGIQEFHPHKVWRLNLNPGHGTIQYVSFDMQDVKQTEIFWHETKPDIIDGVVDMAVWLAEHGYLWKNGEFRNIKYNNQVK